MEAPLLYVYDEKGEYKHSRKAQRRPNGEYILNALFATPIAPPETGEKQAAVWNGSAWEIKEDHRQKRDNGGVIIDTSGTPYWLPEDDWTSPARYLTELGPLPEGAIMEKPEKPEELVQQEKAESLRRARDSKLSATDYLLMADYPIAATDLATVKTYRQALRDLPAQDGFPWDGGQKETPWPEAPELGNKATESADIESN